MNQLLEKVKEQYAKEHRSTWDWERLIRNKVPEFVEKCHNEVTERYAKEFAKAELEKLRDAVERLREWIDGRKGCTWGDTDHDSISVAFGQELEIDQCLEIINKRIEGI